MEVIFILGIISVIIMQLVSKAFNSTTNAKNIVPPVSNSTIPDNNDSTSLDHKESEPFYLDATKKRSMQEERSIVKTNPKKVESSSKGKQMNKEKISFNNASQAKRAFIYSEIFNRKY